MKYKVGDKVKIREDLQTNKDYNNCTCVEEMEEYKGAIAIITKCFNTDIDDDGAYEIDLMMASGFGQMICLKMLHLVQ